MADPTLMIGYDDLLTEVRTFLGFQSSLSSGEQTACDRIIKKGLSEFYSAYSWSFIHPVASITVGAAETGSVSGTPTYDSSSDTSSITLASAAAEEKWVGEAFKFDTSENTYTVRSVTDSTHIVVEDDASGETSGDAYTLRVAAFDLPDNFGSMDIGSIFQRADSGYAPIKVVTAADIYTMRRNMYTGVPRYAAIRSKSSDASEMQKKEVIFYPTPNTTYTLTYQYDMLNDMLASGEYPIGDSRHRNTIIEACLMYAEQQEDDGQGIHTDNYFRALTKSVEIDGRNEPSYIGYNADQSDRSHDFPAYNRAERYLSHYYSTLDALDGT